MAPPARRRPLALFLDLVEAVGNRLPDPIVLFAAGAVLVMALSSLGARQGWSVDQPMSKARTTEVRDAAGQPVTALKLVEVNRRPTLALGPDGQPLREVVREPLLDDQGRVQLERGSVPVTPYDLLSREGLKWVLDNLVGNFTGFHPLGVVLVAMLGIGVAEKTGLVGAVLKALARATPPALLTPAMVLIGVLSSLAADAGYVVLPPVAAALYKASGRSPLAGMAAVFAGVAAGFSANLVITSLDPLLAGLTEAGAAILHPGYRVNPASNWWFMIASTGLLTLVGWGVTARMVEPRYKDKPADEGGPGAVSEEERQAQHLSEGERRGMGAALLAGLLALGLCLALIFVPGAPLYAGEGEAPRWGQAIVPMLLFVFLSLGLAFGLPSGSLRRAHPSGRLDSGLARLMAQTMADMGPYIVLAFFAAQFVAFFNQSKLGVMLAIRGGELLAQAALPTGLLIAAFVVLVMLGNLFIGSASAKYAFFAPVFVPMFMQVGISPELTQAAYRVGDSVTNIITPLNPYFVVILVFMQKYVPKAGIGTLVSLMLPYSLVFWLCWTLLLLAFVLLGLPLGPEGALHYTPSH